MFSLPWVSYLNHDIWDYDQERPEEVKKEPEFYRLDVQCDWQAGGDREVDRGQDHHAGDVDGVDHAVLVLSFDVVGELVDDVHEDGWEVGHHEYLGDFPLQEKRHDNHFKPITTLLLLLNPVPTRDKILLHFIQRLRGRSISFLSII